MFDSISNERKVEIENIALELREVYSKRLVNFKTDNKECFNLVPKKLSPSQILNNSLYSYIKTYQHKLEDDEKVLFTIYNILPDDETFMKMLRENQHDKQQLAKLYGVTPNAIRIRYKYILEKNRKKFNEEEFNLNLSKIFK